MSEALESHRALCDRLYGELPAEAISPEPRSKEAAACFAAAALLSPTGEAERPPPANGRFSRDQIIAAIIRWNSRYGEPPKSIDWDPSRARRTGQAWRAERHERADWPNLAIVRRQFGTMSDWAPARARKLGHERRAQRYLAGEWPHLLTVLKRFGTFAAAVKAAGLEPRPSGRHTRADPGLHANTRFW